MTTRLYPPDKGVTNITVHGRSYSVSAGSFQDVPDQDAAVMRANGWIAPANGNQVGTTANRPTSPSPGQEYLDTTLGYTIVWTGLVWRNPMTAAAV